MDALSLIAATAGAVLVLALVLHVWYALGLSRVFAGRGGEPWRAWVPLLNEAEVFRLGRQDPVRAVLLLVPGVNVYGLVLKARAAHRLGESSGRGAGMTALALVFPPAWAGVLAAGEKVPDAAGAEAAPGDALETATVAEDEPAPISVVPGVEAPGVEAPGVEAPAAAASPGVAAEASAATADPPPPAAAAGGRRTRSVSAELPSVPVLPGPVLIGETPAEETTVAPRTAGPAGAEGAAAPAAPSEQAPAAAADVETHTASTGGETLGRIGETTDSTAQRDGESSAPIDAAPIEEITQTARPRSRRRGEWSLRLPGGERIAVENRTVVLGRRPSSDDEGVQLVVVPDESRTMSKTHARLDWTVTGWTVTDLESTNGVTLVHDDGRAERVPAGGTASVPSRFRLGDAQIELRPDALA